MEWPIGVEDKFAAKVVRRSDGCWDWTGHHDSDGYGRFDIRISTQKTIGAHRFAYLWMKGPIPDGLVLDHLCRNVGCVNPDHVEPVTSAENQRRGLNVALKTHCKQGHEYTPENTIIRWTGRRWCLACRKIADRKQYQRRKLRAEAV